MKGKISMSIMLITLVAALVGGATFAAFSDVETSNGNTFSAGTLTLDMTTGPVTGNFAIDNVAPGYSGSSTYTLKNSGNIDGYVDIENIVVTDGGGVQTEPEGNATGDLSQNMDITVKIGGNTCYSGKLSGWSNWANNNDENVQLAAGGETNLVIDWSIANSVGNAIQGDTVDVSFDVELGQTEGQ